MTDATTDAMNRINELIAERQQLFSRGANGLLPEPERLRMKEISQEIARLWDEHRRAGHPPATPPVDYDWERPRRGRKPKHLTEQAA
ncbi:MAG TPA: hypothetical protein VK457_24925 [Chloroflexota bacterium]|nr:hypothetical protein [Chloroflexota bacterium]